jgi:hypothetical protein
MLTFLWLLSIQDEAGLQALHALRRIFLSLVHKGEVKAEARKRRRREEGEGQERDGKRQRAEDGQSKKTAGQSLRSSSRP